MSAEIARMRTRFFVGQRAGLQEDRIANADIADVIGKKYSDSPRREGT